MIKRLLMYFLPLLLVFLVDRLFTVNYFIFLYLLFYLPYLTLVSLSLNYYSFLEKLLLSAVVYFFGIVPIFYYVFSFFKISLTFDNIFIFVVFINLLIFLLGIKNKLDFRFRLNHIDWYFIFFCIFYIFLHQIFFYYYRFIPEWDGYGNLIKIEESIVKGILIQSNRELFNPSVVLLSVVSNVEPYKIFSFWMILLQSSLLILVKLMTNKLNINGFKKFTAYLTVFAFPVLNMEIDMVRPQNLFIIALPIVFYLIYKDYKTPNIINWLIILIISLVGINYHEFFFFIFLLFALHILVELSLIYKRNKGKKDRIIFGLSILVMFLSLFVFKDKIQILALLKYVAIGILNTIKNTQNWRWWFLSGYQTDGVDLQMGWSGLGGVVKYYGYYFSPVGLVILINFIYFFIVKKIKMGISNYYLLLLLFVFVGFAEVLPRLGYIFLPERFWLNISLIVVFLSFFLINKLNRIMIGILIFCSLIGIGGSIYVASQKKSLVSDNEFKAVVWIKNNTPLNSVFITQGGNGQMVNYFANRIAITPSKDFFLSDKLLNLDNLPNDFENEQIKLDSEVFEYLSNFDYKTGGILELNSFLSLKRNTYLNLLKNKESQKQIVDSPKYVLYSFDKFKNLYAQRSWWMVSNYHGANLDKFKKYPLVYDVDGVLIWRIE